MKSKIFLLIISCLLVVCSCKSGRQAARGSNVGMATANDISIVDGRAVIAGINPETEETSTVTSAIITVRTESVSLVDGSDVETMYGFYVIIGSFREISNARQYNTELAAKGFSPVILASEHGLFRVSVGGHNQENAARRQIAEIRANHEEHEDVWLLVRK